MLEEGLGDGGRVWKVKIEDGGRDEPTFKEMFISCLETVYDSFILSS